MEVKRGIIKDTPLQRFCKFIEEAGELSQAILERDGVKVYAGKLRHSIEDELADCLIVLVSLANRFEVDIEKAIEVKMKKDELKVYQKVV
ncbi:MAG: MazG nucleotide pyrophosphohydrolase domain-containing protein [Methanobacterium sp.]